MNDRLPKNWQVQHDGSELFEQTVIKYLNSFSVSGNRWNGKSRLSYYGKKVGCSPYGFCTIDPFQVPILTIDQFILLTNDFKFGR